MGFASLLSELSSGKPLRSGASTKSVQQPVKKSQTSVPAVTAVKRPSSSSSYSRSPSNSIEDPAVRRLKEARRKEREAREAKSPSTKKSTSSTSKPKPKSQSLQQRKKPNPTPPPPPPSHKTVSTGPKLSFKQLMKHADTIDTSKLAYAAVKKPSLSDAKPKPSKSLQSIKRAERMQNGRPITQQKSRVKNRQPIGERKPNIPTFAKPSPELMKRIKAKEKLQQHQQQKQQGRNTMNRQGYKPEKKPKDKFGIDAEEDSDDDDSYGYSNQYYDDGDDDNFIVDDFENEYSKGEIWNMVNQNKRRSYNDSYDDFEDDMEATGAEIFEEEELALKQAKLDDKREKMLLEKRAAEKRRKLNRM